MDHSTDARPGTEGDEGSPAGELLKKIRRLPEPTQWLIADYIEALNEERVERIVRMEQQVEWALGEIQRLTGAIAGDRR